MKMNPLDKLDLDVNDEPDSLDLIWGLFGGSLTLGGRGKLPLLPPPVTGTVLK